MVPQTIWHGSEEEMSDMQVAVERWCKSVIDGQHCVYDKAGGRTGTCAAHLMLVHDQRAIDTLVFYRRLRSKLLREEPI